MTLSIQIIVITFWHMRHFHCLKLFETLHLQENNSKHKDMSGQTNIIKNT